MYQRHGQRGEQEGQENEEEDAPLGVNPRYQKKKGDDGKGKPHDQAKYGPTGDQAHEDGDGGKKAGDRKGGKKDGKQMQKG